MTDWAEQQNFPFILATVYSTYIPLPFCKYRKCKYQETQIKKLKDYKTIEFPYKWAESSSSWLS